MSSRPPPGRNARVAQGPATGTHARAWARGKLPGTDAAESTRDGSRPPSDRKPHPRGAGRQTCRALPPTTPAGHPPRAHPRGSWVPSRSANERKGAASRPCGTRAHRHIAVQARNAHKSRYARQTHPDLPSPAPHNQRTRQSPDHPDGASDARPPQASGVLMGPTGGQTDCARHVRGGRTSAARGTPNPPDARARLQRVRIPNPSRSRGAEEPRMSPRPPQQATPGETLPAPMGRGRGHIPARENEGGRGATRQGRTQRERSAPRPPVRP